MTERVTSLLKTLKAGEYRKNRTAVDVGKPGFSLLENAELFCKNMATEIPVFIENDRMGFYRYNSKAVENTWEGNYAPNYNIYLTHGFDKILHKTEKYPENEFASAAKKSIDAIYKLCGRYKEKATGDLKKALETVPQNPPQSYYEALVMMKIMIFSLRISGTSHVTLGRFDQYMYPFYEKDIRRGVTEEEILELTEEFFLSINFDTDIYFGIQQGDNGQSLMLGGVNPDGGDSFNKLSEICMKASMELGLIDPKINIRVNKNTPDSLYLLGTEMTKMGLGFPQYSNDDVVIPGLIELGYAPEDAYNYSVAACWEFIVPDGRDIPNIATMNFPKIINDCIYKYAEKCESYDEFFEFAKKEIDRECIRLLNDANNAKFTPNALGSLFASTCIEKMSDYTNNSAKYFNYGFHGAGIANAADALAAVKKLVFEEKKYSAKELTAALDANFENFEVLHSELKNCPKMGNNDDYADSIASNLMQAFCDSMKPLKNIHGGICRPGTGSAMEYIYSAQNVGATADGRYAYTPYSSSFSPAITSHVAGPLSVVQSFTKFDMKKIINGGPLTLEIHDTTFRNESGIEKVAQLVKSFILLGGHQLQLNAINRDRLLDAQKHPEKYPNLIVRVWGWSGYFNELDVEFQNHVISRTEFNM